MRRDRDLELNTFDTIFQRQGEDLPQPDRGRFVRDKMLVYRDQVGEAE